MIYKKNDTTPYLIIANWKMYFSYKEACAWAATYSENIAQLLHDKNISFILCPSFDALANIAPAITHNKLYLGAQDCSAYQLGAYTGQIAAESLAQLACSYCLVGHSETRKYTTNIDVAQKVKQLLEWDICPIICIGETQKEYEQSRTIDVLTQQLEPLKNIFENRNITPYIAYEPIWSIGTDTVPTNNHLNYVYKSLDQLCARWNFKKPLFIYGGSVSVSTIKELNKVSYIRGILIGRASTDFQKIKTLVSLIEKD